MIRIRQICIQAFRGIPNTLQLDLSAPLTLIYAPNGSGKTTICDAVEWLLTGAIKRLETLQSDSDLRCRFAGEATPMLVSAEIEIGSETMVVERRSMSCRWRLNGAAWRSVNQSELLEKLAASATQDNVHKAHADLSRQIWLRGTRFLSGEALAVLLDSHSDSRVVRQRIFADLLGVGHILETERQLDGYLEEMGQFLRTQEARVDDKQKEIKNRLDQIPAQSDRDSKERLVEAAELICFAEERLGMLRTQPSPTTVAAAQAALSSLRSAFDVQKVRWGQKRNAELLISAHWPQRQTLHDSMGKDQSRFAEIAHERTETGKFIDDARERQRSIEANVRSIRVALATLNARNGALKSAQDRVDRAIREYPELSALVGMSAAEVFAAFDSEESAGDLSARLARLRDLAPLVPRAYSVRQELEERDGEFKHLAAITPSAQDTLARQDELAASKHRVAGWRSECERISQPVEQLRLLAQSVLQSLGHEETACPVCSHDWESAEALERKILDASKRMPMRLRELEQQIQWDEERQRELEDRMLLDSQAIAHAEDLERQIGSLRATLSAFSERVRAAGLDDQDPSLAKSMELAIARINFIPLIRQLRDELSAAESALGSIVPTDMPVLNVYAQLQVVIAGKSKEKQAALEEAIPRQEAVVKELAAAENALQVLLSEQEEISRNTQQNEDNVRAFSSAWTVLADGRAWSESEFAKAKADLRNQFESHRDVERALAQADALLTEQSLIGELERLQVEYAGLVGKLHRFQKYMDAAGEIRQNYRELRQRHVHSQMIEFVRVISALFLRMQSNLVYDSVTFGNESMSWRALAESYEVDPETTFSQGQRQDFALSIFLARARGLGGTFIMDEPVAHLDDLNRVALLDVFRAIAVENLTGLSIVLTTASKALVRHMMEKFSRIQTNGVDGTSSQPSLSLVSIDGNPRVGIRAVREPTSLLSQ